MISKLNMYSLYAHRSKMIILIHLYSGMALSIVVESIAVEIKYSI